MTAMSDNSLNEIRLDRFQLNVSLIIQTLSTCGHQVWLSDDQCIAQLDIIFPTLYKTVIYLEQFFLNECRYALVSCQPNDDVQTELISILLSCHVFCYGSYGKYPWWLRITRGKNQIYEGVNVRRLFCIVTYSNIKKDRNCKENRHKLKRVLYVVSSIFKCVVYIIVCCCNSKGKTRSKITEIFDSV